MCENFADGFVARIQVKLSLTLLIAGVFGFVFECLNAFEYLQSPNCLTYKENIVKDKGGCRSYIN